MSDIELKTARAKTIERLVSIDNGVTKAMDFYSDVIHKKNRIIKSQQDTIENFSYLIECLLINFQESTGDYSVSNGELLYKKIVDRLHYRDMRNEELDEIALSVLDYIKGSKND